MKRTNYKVWYTLNDNELLIGNVALFVVAYYMTEDDVARALETVMQNEYDNEFQQVALYRWEAV